MGGRAEIDELRRYKAALDAHAIVAVTDHKGVITDVNDKFCEISQYSREELIGHTHRLVNSGYHPREFFREMWRTIASGHIWRGEICNRAKDDSLYWVDSTIVPFLDENGRPYQYVAIRADVTPRKRAEEAAEKLLQRLNEGKRLQAVGRFASGIAHDFNNILTTLSAGASLMRVPGSIPHERCLDQIDIGIARGVDLVRQIMAFTRDQRTQREEMLLSPVVREVSNLFRPLCGPQIDLLISVRGREAPVLASDVQVHQMVLNLCKNALQAIGPGPGQIHLTLEPAEVDEGIAALHPDLKPGKYMRLSIVDTGSGMDQDTLNRIFEPFFTTKPPGSGSGLGLSVVHGLVQEHGGAITVYSEVGVGTAMNIYFPSATGQEAETKESAIPEPSARILVLDDDRDILDNTTELLAQLGYSADAFADPEEALSAFEAAPDQYGVMVADYVLGRSNGLNTAKALQQTRAIPVILCTGLPEAILQHTIGDLPVVALLRKPFTRECLRQAVEDALRWQPGDPSAA